MLASNCWRSEGAVAMSISPVAATTETPSPVFSEMPNVSATVAGSSSVRGNGPVPALTRRTGPLTLDRAPATALPPGSAPS
jgi:hypothetical protein